MTEILEIVLSQPTSDLIVSIQQQIENILQNNEISYTRINFYSLQALLPFSLLKPQQKLHPFQDYHLVVTINYQLNVLSIRASIFNESMMPIKVGSPAQQNFLLKYAITLNQKDTEFQIKTNPLTGEIQLQSVFYMSNNFRVSEGVYECLNNIINKSEIIYKILEALEIVPSDSQQNYLFNKIMEKIEPLRTYFADSTNPELGSPTVQQKLDKNTYFIEEKKKINLAHSANINMVQKLKKTYVEENLSYFCHNSTKVKVSNFAYIALDSTPALQNLLKAIQCQDFLAYHDYRTDTFRTEGREIQIQYKSQKPESITYQYAIVDKISRKKNYFTFLKEYIIVRNHLQITNHYLLTKKYSDQVITLHRYNHKNKIVLSLETKMRIASQIISIACLCVERMDNFEPSLALTNFFLDKNFNLKLNNIQKSEVQPRIELLQAIYWLLFNKKYFVLKQHELKALKFNNIESQQLKFMGPAVVLKIFLKSLENYEKKLNTNNNIETLLLLVNRISETYSKVLNGNEDPIQYL